MALIENPNDPVLSYRCGVALSKSGIYDSAIDRYNVAIAHAELDQYQEAIADFSKAIDFLSV